MKDILNISELWLMIYTGPGPKTVRSWDFKGKSGKDPKSSMVFSGRKSAGQERP